MVRAKVTLASVASLTFASHRVARTCLTTLAFLTAFNFFAWSQVSDTGKTEFLSNCAGCHGVDAKGDGAFGSSF
jgi:cytochrome c553